MEKIIKGILQSKYDQYYHDYVSNVSLNNIEFIKVNAEQLLKFYYQNYFDDENESFSYWIDNDNITPFGLHYLTMFEHDNGYSYLLGICDNNKKTKTIVSCVIYNDKYYISDGQINPITFLQTVEVNQFFRGNGIIKQVYSHLLDFIDKKQNILVTSLSSMGSMYNLFEKLKEFLRNNECTSDIRLEDELNEEYFTKVLTKK